MVVSDGGGGVNIWVALRFFISLILREKKITLEQPHIASDIGWVALFRVARVIRSGLWTVPPTTATTALARGASAAPGFRC